MASSAKEEELSGHVVTNEVNNRNSNHERDAPMDTTKDQAEPKKFQSTTTSSKQPSVVKRLWAKTGLTLPIIILMLKAAIPPVIALAMYQADAVAKHFTTIGYLVAIQSVLGMSILPRAKWFQHIFMAVLAVCFGAATVLLATWTSLKAREHTSPPGKLRPGYNSSASAVSAIWLFFLVYLGNSLRSARPPLQIPVIVFSIFINVALIYSPEYVTMAQGIAFVKKLLEAFLTGFGLAGGVSLFIFPANTRRPVFGMLTGYLQSLRGTLKAQMGYIQGLETENYFAAEKNTPNSRAAAVRGATAAMLALNTKLKSEIPFAKREVAYGKLNAGDINAIYKKTRDISVPMIGLTSIIEVFERMSVIEGWNTLPTKSGSDSENEHGQRSLADWQKTLTSLNDPFDKIVKAMDEGVEHVLYQLELVKKPKSKSKQQDQSKNDRPRPGDANFTDYLAEKTEAFYEERFVTLKEWCESRGIEIPKGSFDAWTSMAGRNMFDESSQSDRRQAFVVLYMEYLLGRASRALLALVRFADSKVEDGTMKRKRLIRPNLKRLKKWFHTALSPNRISNDDKGIIDQPHDSANLAFGDALVSHRDPEHLPPENFLERIGNYIRVIPRVLRSPHSTFGFRAASATMSIAIVAYLKDSYVFFTKQRLVWAMIMVAFSMQRTAGSSAFNFVMRVVGTVIAMVASFIIWYIVDGHTAGVIVFVYPWIALCFGLVITKPQFAIAGVLSAVSAILVIGYELQVRKLGVKASTATGQPYYPIYELAPYRIAAVAGGLLVAYIWTIFPFPITEHGELRRTLGGTLYLLANFYSIVHETIGARVRDDGGDPNDKTSPGRRLEKARFDVFAKVIILIEQMKMSSAYTKWQINMGGRFPKETYDKIITLCGRLVGHSALIGYASTSFATDLSSPIDDEKLRATKQDSHTSAISGNHPESSAWLKDFRNLLASTETTSHEIVSILILISSAITNNQPLPPYLKMPEPFALVARLRELDKDILNVRHMAEPGYAAFAVMQIASRGLLSDVEEMTALVKQLVGELDFSYHALQTLESGGLNKTVTHDFKTPGSSSGSSGGKGKND